MAISTLDQKTALLVIDLQKGILALPLVDPVVGVVQRADALVEAFHRRGLPVVFVTVAGGAPGRTEWGHGGGELPADFTQLAPELDFQPQDHSVTKRTWGAFTNTDLDDHLRAQGVTQVVIAGVATSMGVESTARHAHEHGFHVALAVDAMTDMNADAHFNSITRIFPGLGETGTTKEIVDLLERTGA
ncbi:isochorismatase family protein [Agrobacterium vitis]|uniref:Isochorismatase family protein n=1 Tax=Agrobacterium vitis TaxID=373 RepID=A0A6L6VKI0_AGRVI|nr:isochorismatase family protein [Agrobacterium vitis]MUZ75285.1 isochorismatase family protein [Agrobacterium vitis]